MPLGVICNSFPRFKRRTLQHCYCSYFQNPDLFLPLYFSCFFPLGLFEAFLSFSITISFFVSIPSLIFVFPLKSKFSFCEFVCVQVQEAQDAPSLSFILCVPLRCHCLHFVCLSTTTMLTPWLTLFTPFQEGNVNATITNIFLLTFCACWCIVSYRSLFMNAQDAIAKNY